MNFQDLILTLQAYWGRQGCAILQPYDGAMGAGTFHWATFLRPLGPRPWRCAYVQPSRRPGDARYGENPNRLGHYYQFQALMKPSPPDIQRLYLGSLEAIGLDLRAHDVRFVEGRRSDRDELIDLGLADPCELVVPAEEVLPFARFGLPADRQCLKGFVA